MFRGGGGKGQTDVRRGGICIIAVQASFMHARNDVSMELNVKRMHAGVAVILMLLLWSIH